MVRQDIEAKVDRVLLKAVRVLAHLAGTLLLEFRDLDAHLETHRVARDEAEVVGREVCLGEVIVDIRTARERELRPNDLLEFPSTNILRSENLGSGTGAIERVDDFGHPQLRKLERSRQLRLAVDKTGVLNALLHERHVRRVIDAALANRDAHLREVIGRKARVVLDEGVHDEPLVIRRTNLKIQIGCFHLSVYLSLADSHHHDDGRSGVLLAVGAIRDNNVAVRNLRTGTILDDLTDERVAGRNRRVRTGRGHINLVARLEGERLDRGLSGSGVGLSRHANRNVEIHIAHRTEANDRTGLDRKRRSERTGGSADRNVLMRRDEHTGEGRVSRGILRANLASRRTASRTTHNDVSGNLNSVNAAKIRLTELTGDAVVEVLSNAILHYFVPFFVLLSRRKSSGEIERSGHGTIRNRRAVLSTSLLELIESARQGVECLAGIHKLQSGIHHADLDGDILRSTQTVHHDLAKERFATRSEGLRRNEILNRRVTNLLLLLVRQALRGIVNRLVFRLLVLGLIFGLLIFRRLVLGLFVLGLVFRLIGRLVFRLLVLNGSVLFLPHRATESVADLLQVLIGAAIQLSNECINDLLLVIRIHFWQLQFE